MDACEIRFPEPAGTEAIGGHGVNVRPFPPDVMEVCFKSALELYAEIVKDNEDFRVMLDSVSNVRSDSYQWLQTEYYSYNTFQIRNRARTLYT